MLQINSMIDSEETAGYLSNYYALEDNELESKKLTKDAVNYKSQNVVLPAEMKGNWGGKISKEMGLSGSVDTTTFKNLVHGQSPDGKPLTSKIKGYRRAGYDFTIDVPKSVTLATLVYDDHRILDAFNKSREKMMYEIEKDVETRVRKEGLNHNRKTGKLIYADFVHTTDRPVGDTADPQLHAHIFVFNVTQDPIENEFKSIQLGNVKQNGNYYNAIFNAHLAKELAKLGYDIEQTKNGFEIKGISRDSIEQYSKRTKQIEKFAKDNEVLDPKSKAKLGRQVRASKDYSKSMEELKNDWNDQSNQVERQLVRDAIDGFQKPNYSENLSTDQIIHNSIRHCLERQSTISEKDLITDILKNSVEYGYTLDDITFDLNKAVKNKKILKGVDNGIPHYTTKEILDSEKRILELVKRQDEKKINSYNKPQDVPEFLSDEQKKVIEQIGLSKSNISIVNGKAGTGKSTTLSTISKNWERIGGNTIAIAPTSKAAQLLADDGFDAMTLQKFITSQEQLDNCLIILDEAGMASTQQLEQVLEIASSGSNKVILAGDTSQHKSVQKGHSLKLIEEKGNVPLYSLTQIRRQKNQEYLNIVNSIAQDNIPDAIKMMEEQGKFSIQDSDKDRHTTIAQDYVGLTRVSYKTGKNPNINAMVVTLTHEEGDRITGKIREQLKKEDLIGKKDTAKVVLKPMNLTQQDKVNKANLEKGLVVVADKRTNYCERGATFSIESKDSDFVTLRSNNPSKGVQRLELHRNEMSKFTFYEAQEKGFAKSDSIRINRKSRINSDSKEWQVSNGQTYTIDSIKRDGSIQLNNGKTLPKEFKHFTHGYTSTSFSAQGSKSRNVLISMPTMQTKANNKEAFYVSLTRGVDNCKVYTDDVDMLSRQVQKGQIKTLASDLKFDQPKHNVRSKGRGMER